MAPVYISLGEDGIPDSLVPGVTASEFMQALLSVQLYMEEFPGTFMSRSKEDELTTKKYMIKQTYYGDLMGLLPLIFDDESTAKIYLDGYLIRRREEESAEWAEWVKTLDDGGDWAREEPPMEKGVVFEVVAIPLYVEGKMFDIDEDMLR